MASRRGENARGVTKDWRERDDGGDAGLGRKDDVDGVIGSERPQLRAVRRERAAQDRNAELGDGATSFAYRAAREETPASTGERKRERTAVAHGGLAAAHHEA